MLAQLTIIKTLIDIHWTRLQALRDDERGMTTETVIITAVLAALAIAATAIIVTKVTDKANRIQTD